jgi:hypothetical protein
MAKQKQTNPPVSVQKATESRDADSYDEDFESISKSQSASLPAV